MIDAYTIGITLALNDGVSAGIDQIRRDLLLLDQAIAQTAAGLNTLQSLGRDIGSPQLPEPTRPDRAQPPQLPKNEADTPTGAPASTPIAPGKIREQASQPGESGHTVESVAPKRPRANETSFTAIAAPLVENQPRAISQEIEYRARAIEPLAQPDAIPAGLSPADDRQPLAAHSDAPRAPASTAGMSRATRDPATPDFAAFASRMALPAEGGTRNWLEPTPDAASALLAPPEPILAHVSAKGDLNPLQPAARLQIEWHASIPQSEASGSAIPGIPSPFIPYSPQPKPMAPTPQLADRRAASAQPFERVDGRNFAEQANQKGAARSTSECKAEILVDGRVLGRMVSEQLAAQLVRPQHGFTGMDPRAVPTWPGASVG